jgi:D-erythro-7,8-dihydroneopterin triphosphate epimerase
MEYRISPATVRITNLRLDVVIGCNEWERHRTQEVVINITLEFDAAEAVADDALAATVDYRAMKKRIIASVKEPSFNLLESLTAHVLGLVMENGKVNRATVTIDKPKALRFADSVSVTLSGQRGA